MNEVMRSLGRIEQKIDGHTLWMQKHVADDALMAVDIKGLQIAQAASKGSRRTWSILGNVFAGVSAAAATYLGTKH